MLLIQPIRPFEREFRSICVTRQRATEQSERFASRRVDLVIYAFG